MCSFCRLIRVPFSQSFRCRGWHRDVTNQQWLVLWTKYDLTHHICQELAGRTLRRSLLSTWGRDRGSRVMGVPWMADAQPVRGWEHCDERIECQGKGRSEEHTSELQ